MLHLNFIELKVLTPHFIYYNALWCAIINRSMQNKYHKIASGDYFYILFPSLLSNNDLHFRFLQHTQEK